MFIVKKELAAIPSVLSQYTVFVELLLLPNASHEGIIVPFG
jgi:hypothetical protein